MLSVSLDPFFKVYRDDGLGLTFLDPSIIPQILAFFNKYNDAIQWTIPQCSTCSAPEVLCCHYQHLEFLDCKISWKQVRKGGIFVWQFSVQSFSKSTDCHAYLSPTSCSSPHLNSKGIALAKTVGTRLRSINTNDESLLIDLNYYAGYMVARGYDEESIKYHLSNMANRSRISLLKGDFYSERNTVIPLVTSLHPAITVLTKLTKQFFKEASETDSLLQFITPPSSLIVAYSRLPNLQLLLCKNDQNSLIHDVPPQRSLGYVRSSCNCDVCKASIFSPYVCPQSMPNYAVKIPSTTSCKSGPIVIYYLCCKSKWLSFFCCKN